MKISITVVMILTTLFCLLPYVWFIMVGQINTKKKETQFTNIVKALQLSFTEKEQWNHNLMGYDKGQNTLTFIKLMNEEYKAVTIQLKQLKSCQIQIKTQALINDKKRASKLLTLDLELLMKTNEAPIILNFYNYQEEFTEDLELKRAQKWETLIEQAQLNTIEPPKAA